MRRATLPLFLLFGFSIGSKGFAEETGPVNHVVFFKFKADAPPEQVDRVLEEFPRLPSRIPGFLGFQWGVNISPEKLDQGFTHGFLLTFESAAALAAYNQHPAHQDLLKLGGPLIEKIFVFDLPAAVREGGKILPAAEPWSVHHLVFFQYKDGTSDEQRSKIAEAFAALEKKIPGILSYEAGRRAGEDTRHLGFTDGFLLTFVSQDARDDYLPHPDHRAFGALLGPIIQGVLVLDFAVRPSERHLLVTGGLRPFQVVQRDGGGTRLGFNGISSGAGSIEARLLAGQRVVEGFDWRPAGKAAHGSFEGALEGVPAGGEYTVEIRRRDALGNVAEKTGVPHVLVGDLWILAGQSNMEGVGDLVDVEEPDPRVHNFTMAHEWELATEPLHTLADSRDPVHVGGRYAGLDEAGRRARREADRKNRKKGSGLGLAFAKHLVERTGIPVGLVSSAHGGTSLGQWDPALKDKGGESLYGSMLRQAKRAGGRVKGVLWYQGESDASPEAAPLYREKFKQLVAAFRADFASPQLPFYTVQIGRFAIDGPNALHWNAIQETQRTVVKEIPGTAVVPAVDFSLDDLIHVGTQDLKRLGIRLAKVARRELFGDHTLKTGPEFAGAALEAEGRALRVRFTGVNGRLLPERKVSGFAIRKGDGAEISLIYSAAVDPKQPDTVLLKLNGKPPEGAKLWYGAGYNPSCNLADQEDLAPCAFGPIEVK